MRVEERDYRIFAYYSSVKAVQDKTVLYEKVRKRGEELQKQQGKTTMRKQEPTTT